MRGDLGIMRNSHKYLHKTMPNNTCNNSKKDKKMTPGTSGSLPNQLDLSHYSGGKNGEVTTQRTSSGHQYQQQRLWTNNFIVTTMVFSETDWFESHTIREVQVVNLSLEGDTINTKDSYTKKIINMKYDPDHANRIKGYYSTPGDPN